MAKFCSNCGNQMGDADAVCSNCGKAVGVGGGAAAAPAASAAGGITSNVAGLLAYLVIPAIIFLIIEPYKNDRFVKFHSWQSLIMAVGAWVISAVLAATLILSPFALLVGLAHLVLAIIAALKALQNEKWKVPFIGDFAEKQANS